VPGRPTGGWPERATCSSPSSTSGSDPEELKSIGIEPFERLAGDPGEVDAIPPPQERPLRPGEIPGLRAVYCLVDRTTGRAAALSIWESREAMEAAEARGDDQRTQAVQKRPGVVPYSLGWFAGVPCEPPNGNASRVTAKARRMPR
jgi:heme-degrading monooxygenase HmoA